VRRQNHRALAAELDEPHRHLRLCARGDAAALAEAVRALAGVRAVTVDSCSEPSKGSEPPAKGPLGTTSGPQRVEKAEPEATLYIECECDVREEIAATAVRMGGLRELAPARPGLDALFQRLTTMTPERAQ
jgi:hypothetical protein